MAKETCHYSNVLRTFVTLLLFTGGRTAGISSNTGTTVATGFCPKICTCDMIEDLKRADCSNEKLINTYTDVPYGVEILDLSINIISSIEDDNFRQYDKLVKLFLSENSIQTISLDAFANQRRLTTLDLSHNRLEHLHEHLFERNEQLVDLNLSSNNFMMLPDKPFLKSYSITFLHLSDCRIPHIFDTMFIDLPNLQSLDLTKNIMNTLATVPFAHLRRLNWIQLNDNRWNCKSDGVRNTIQWMKSRIPIVGVESCLLVDISYQGNKFERLQEHPSLVDMVGNDRHDVAIEEVWRVDSKRARGKGDIIPAILNQTCIDPSTESCVQFVECQRKYSELYHAYEELLAQKGHRNGGYFRSGVFLGGFLVGVLFGSFTTYTICWAVRSCRMRSAQKRASRSPDQKRLQRELRREFRDRNRFEHTRLNESPVPNRTDRFPGSARASVPHQDEIYRNHEHTRQFLVNLFSKRQARYVRSNSQLANINNRHIPPTQIREGQTEHQMPLRAASHSGQMWEQQFADSDAHERMPAFQDSVEQQPTWISIRPMAPGTLTRGSRTRSETPATSESPPPPYIECTLDVEPKVERISMY